MSGMKWKKPPAVTAGRGLSDAISRDVAELQANPGVWAVVREGAKSAAPARSYKDRGCIAQSHRVNTSPDRFDIYAMWPVDEPETREDCG